MSEISSGMRGLLAAGAFAGTAWRRPAVRRRRGPEHLCGGHPRYPRTTISVPWLVPGAGFGRSRACAGRIWRWRRRRRQRPRVLLLFEAALQRLDAIRALMQPASASEFSIAVTDIVRGYIEQGFRLTATHRTTEEFLCDLLESPNATLARHRALLSEFLHQCDLVKFAGMSLTSQNMESLHHSACEFVRTTADQTHDPLPST